MKIALVLTGHLRTFHRNIDQFKKIINDYDADVFIDTWERYGFWSEDSIGFNDNTNIVTKEDILNLNIPNLKHINIDNFDDYKDEFLKRAEQFETSKLWYVRQTNVISMWYKRFNALKYVKYWNNLQSMTDHCYDTIILTRPDLRINNLYGVNNNKLKLCNLYKPVDSLADILFAGSIDDVYKVCDVYNHLEETIDDKVIFCGHQILKWWLVKNKIEYEVVNYPVELYNTINGYCQK